MQPAGYSPYAARHQRKESRFKLPPISGGAKKWILIIVGILLGLFLIFYLLLGELRFFVNNSLRLTWFSKNYVILLQNNYESRPGGGFITAYGNLNFFLGWPTELSFHNSYDINTDSYVTPPYPHEEFLKNEWYQGYSFRDANWDPDFPTATEDLIEFYQKKFPDRDVDGIIVVNFSLIENLVDRLGGISVDGKYYTKENLFSALTNTVNDVDRHDKEALANRKDVLSELADALVPKAKWHPFKTKAALIQGLHEKNLYFWFKSPTLQQKVEKKGWANALVLPEGSDFLAVNIANLGSKKADRYVQKEVHSYVNITKELPEVTTEVTIRYPGFKNTFSDDYKGYLQLVIPRQAQLDEALLDSRVTDEGEFKVIGDKIILPAGSKTTLTYTYTLPRTLLPKNEYNLRLIRQSGSNVRYSVVVETAPNRLLASTDFEVRENRAYWDALLKSDRELSVSVLADTAPPYPIEQVFEDLNTIKIYWNEPIDDSTGSNALNYTITDTDQINGEVTDEVKVVYAEVTDASISKLELEGVTKQNLERYRIELKNIRDQAGNHISPDPKEITVVQRMEKKTSEL